MLIIFECIASCRKAGRLFLLKRMAEKQDIRLNIAQFYH